MFERFYKLVRNSIRKFTVEGISTYASQASFFIILSIFPFILILLTLIKYTPIDEFFLLSQALKIMPAPLDPLIETIIRELYESTAGSTLLPVSALLALWSSSKGLLAMIRGMNSIYRISDRRNFFLLRLVATLYTVVFLAAILVTLVLLVFGRSIYDYIGNNLVLLHEFIQIVLEQRSIISFCILVFLFLIVYKFMPAKHHAFFVLLPGSLFSAFGWMAASYFFSVYLEHFPYLAYTYGSLTTFILLMLWIYADMYILFLGAQLNISLNRRMEILSNLKRDRRTAAKQKQ
ncbi:YihY/virulence factor BrkB family protein [Parasporobacterium paucivorans]|uniref:Membrane protein n=1 Tax=Parasporobacterium paucivorans DSM 15970 TaxID=1122934 RepID=A0A1M6G3V4_9FIRM|nr:YihY/virulence factor BrkB family protein [Parasporobacterium paucivorans]SHJ04661.1 membrane protein [Parasporobacterium paucivorans DSM 15970]